MYVISIYTVYMIYDWTKIMRYGKHELGRINIGTPLIKMSCFTPTSP